MIEAGVLPGVLLAIELSVALAVSRSALPRDAALGDAPDRAGHRTGWLVFRFDAPLFFFNIKRFTERVEQSLVDNLRHRRAP